MIKVDFFYKIHDCCCINILKYFFKRNSKKVTNRWPIGLVDLLNSRPTAVLCGVHYMSIRIVSR